MTIRSLKIFIAVAEEKTTYAASARMFISQPAVSQTIRELEQEFQVRLFERLSNKLYITETGKELLKQAYHLVDSFDRTEEMLRKKGQSRMLRIGASVSVGTCMLNDILHRLNDADGTIETYVVVDNTSTIEQQLLESQLDAALVEGVILSRDLVSRKVCEDELILTAYPGHPLADGKIHAMEEIAGESFISREAGSNDRNQFEQMIQSCHIEIRRKWTSSNTQAIKNAVMAGHGIAVLSSMIVEEELKKGQMTQIHLDGAQIRRDIKLVIHKDKYLSDELRVFAGICGISELSN